MDALAPSRIEFVPRPGAPVLVDGAALGAALLRCLPVVVDADECVLRAVAERLARHPRVLCFVGRGARVVRGGGSWLAPGTPCGGGDQLLVAVPAHEGALAYAQGLGLNRPAVSVRADDVLTA